jgi:hypothetical protein
MCSSLRYHAQPCCADRGSERMPLQGDRTPLGAGGSRQDGGGPRQVVLSQVVVQAGAWCSEVRDASTHADACATHYNDALDAFFSNVSCHACMQGCEVAAVSAHMPTLQLLWCVQKQPAPASMTGSGLFDRVVNRVHAPHGGTNTFEVRCWQKWGRQPQSKAKQAAGLHR